MTFELTSREVCPRNLNEGDFDFGGISVEGCGGKVRWNTLRQGDTWITGLISEDELLTNSNCTSSVINLQPELESYTNEHSEVDWISKEIAYQELICNDRSSNGSAPNNGKNDSVKDEHDMDVISTLTAVAALFRDWCTFETDLSQPMVNGCIEELSNSEKGSPDEWVWINETQVEASKVVDKITGMSSQHDFCNRSHYNLAWDDFFKERLKSKQMLYQAFFHHVLSAKEVENVSRWLQGVIDSEEEDSNGCHGHAGTNLCVQSRAKEHSCLNNSLRHYGGCAECHNTLTIGQFGKETPVNAYGELDINMAQLVNTVLHGRLETFETQHPAASRYSFGKGSDAMFLAEQGEMFTPAVNLEDQQGSGQSFERGSDLTKGTRNATWFGSNFGEGLHPLMMEEKKFKYHNLGEWSNLAKEKSYEMEVCNEGGDTGTQIFLMHEALFYVLSYMRLKDLLTMEKVSKFLRDWIRSDVLLWQELHVKPPLSKCFTDEVLLELASRSKGQLRCLNLVDCTKLTEPVVERVVFSNPRLTKLSLPGCTRISADSIVRMVKALGNCGRSGLSGLKQLRIRNIYGLTREHLVTLENMLATGSWQPRKPQYYHNGHQASFCDDERPIDVEECPKCANVRLVYDCTREGCQQKQGSKFQECRACFLCTARCEECGRCINDNDYEETFSLDLLCSCCWLLLPKCAACSRPGCGRHADHFIRTPDTM